MPALFKLRDVKDPHGNVWLTGQTLRQALQCPLQAEGLVVHLLPLALRRLLLQLSPDLHDVALQGPAERLCAVVEVLDLLGQGDLALNCAAGRQEALKGHQLHKILLCASQFQTQSLPGQTCFVEDVYYCIYSIYCTF